jgi:digeranylgeranylglycerophospholipid reductase
VNRPLKRTVTDGLLLAGDSARLIDPLTGGGIANACVSGKLAGETAAAAVRAGEVTAGRLERYERAWRGRMEKKLQRNYLAKEKVTQLDDDAFNQIIGSLSDVDTDASTWSLLAAIGRRHPRFIAEFAPLLWRH